MYVTKIIDKMDNMEILAQSIDELCNQTDKEGYSLVTYQFCSNHKKVTLTFKKG